jgi:sulfur relay (sulfurtransferase) DsrF/TusC family protein
MSSFEAANVIITCQACFQRQDCLMVEEEQLLVRPSSSNEIYTSKLLRRTTTMLFQLLLFFQITLLFVTKATTKMEGLKQTIEAAESVAQ